MTGNFETASPRTLKGKCLCGTVRYEAADQFLYSLNCHCSNCRRATGAAFKPFAGIERGKLKVTSGADHLLGTLVDSPSIRPSAHIFVGSKASWYIITDDLPQHEEFR